MSAERKAGRSIRSRQKPLEPALRRESITAAAARVFAKKGYHRASVSDIVLAAGIARGTFYLYFDGKLEVFEAILDEVLAHLKKAITRIDPEDSVGVFDQLMENVRRVMDIFSGHAELAGVYVARSAGVDPGIDAKIAEFDNRLAEMIAHSLRVGREMGLVRDLDERIAAWAILGGVREVVFRMMGGARAGEKLAEARDTLIRELLVYYLHGLLVAGGEAENHPSRRERSVTRKTSDRPDRAKG